MKVLGVETATGCLSVALMDGATVLARHDCEAPGHHAKFLVPAIDDVLRTSGCGLWDLQGLAVSIGPGSFTGLRVGLATMMGFRMVTRLPLAAVPTLEALAWNLRRSQEVLCPILKSRRGEVYWALYQWRDSGLAQLSGEQVGSLEQLAHAITGPTLVYGEGWQANRDELGDLFNSFRVPIREASADAMSASAVSVALAGTERIQHNDIAGSGISPRYIHRAEAEIMMDRLARHP